MSSVTIEYDESDSLTPIIEEGRKEHAEGSCAFVGSVDELRRLLGL